MTFSNTHDGDPVQEHGGHPLRENLIRHFDVRMVGRVPALSRAGTRRQRDTSSEGETKGTYAGMSDVAPHVVRAKKGSEESEQQPDHCKCIGVINFDRMKTEMVEQDEHWKMMKRG